MCRTHCWLSEVLWLFQRLLAASGPTAAVFYRPSGLGTGSGSWEGKCTFKIKNTFKSMNSPKTSAGQMVSSRTDIWTLRHEKIVEHSPAPSSQQLVYETVLGRNQGLSVGHRRQHIFSLVIQKCLQSQH